jgi:hypothetical protein
MSTPMLSPAIGQAGRILRENPPATWPHGREARSVIQWAYDDLAEALDFHARLLHGSLHWEQLYDPDRGFWENSEQATLDAVEAYALDAALALEKRVAEYRTRNYAAQGTARLEVA